MMLDEGFGTPTNRSGREGILASSSNEFRVSPANHQTKTGNIWSTMGVRSGQSNDAVHATCVRRVALERRPPVGLLEDVDESSPLWFVKVTIGGERLPVTQVHEELERLATDRGFVVSVRYEDDRAEVRYWDECADADEAVQQALSLWSDDEVPARLPGWQVTGLEVADRETARRQWDRGDHPCVFALGEVIPFD
jgi:hypothetical protein